MNYYGKFQNAKNTDEWFACYRKWYNNLESIPVNDAVPEMREFGLMNRKLGK